MLLSADSPSIIFCQKSIAVEPGLLELLQKVAGVRVFLRHSVEYHCAYFL